MAFYFGLSNPQIIGSLQLMIIEISHFYFKKRGIAVIILNTKSTVNIDLFHFAVTKFDFLIRKSDFNATN